MCCCATPAQRKAPTSASRSSASGASSRRPALGWRAADAQPRARARRPARRAHRRRADARPRAARRRGGDATPSSSCATTVARSSSSRSTRRTRSRCADTIAFMELGRIVWCGPRDEADLHLLSGAVPRRHGQHLIGDAPRPRTTTRSFFRETTAKFLDELVPPAEVRRLRDDPVGFDPRRTGGGARELGWTSLLVERGARAAARSAGRASSTSRWSRTSSAPTPRPARCCRRTSSPPRSARRDAHATTLLGELLAGAAVASWCFTEPRADDRLGDGRARGPGRRR